MACMIFKTENSSYRWMRGAKFVFKNHKKKLINYDLIKLFSCSLKFINDCIVNTGLLKIKQRTLFNNVIK